MKNKKALSQVVTTVLLILLSLAMIAGVWQVINNFVLNKLEGTQSCFDTIDKLELNTDYTCYNATSDQTLVSISVKDVEKEQIKSLLVAITFEESSQVFTLKDYVQDIPNFINYNGSAGVVIPNPESGKTFIAQISGRPLKVEIAPNAGKKQCDVVSRVEPLPLCE